VWSFPLLKQNQRMIFEGIFLRDNVRQHLYDDVDLFDVSIDAKYIIFGDILYCL
jgi:hypothetical protein